MFKNMKIGMRLGLGFGVVLVLLGIIILTSIKELASVNEITNRMANQDWVKSVVAKDIVDLANANVRSSYEFFVVTDK